MKQSVVTGKYIFESMLMVKDEIKELNEALDELYDLDTNSIAVRILEDKRDEKFKELRQLENTEYAVQHTKSDNFF